MSKKCIAHIILEGYDDSKIENTKIVSSGNDRVIAEGVLQTGEEINRNIRVYKTKDLKSEINSKRTIELINAGYFRGESGHPTDSSLIRQQTIVPSNTCVNFRKIWVEGNDVKAHFEGTYNELGDFFDKDLRAGFKPAFSLRALGRVKVDGGKNYVEDLKIITYDHVIYPSHPNAYTTKILSEAANGINLESAFSMKQENCADRMIPITTPDIVNYIKSESANLNIILNSFDTIYNSISLTENGRMVQLVDKEGSVLLVNLESHIQDEIQNYCIKL